MLNDIATQFGIKIRSISEVEDSHSSTVYKCNLLNGENVRSSIFIEAKV